ncbi:MAG: hypothetical protein BWK80_53235 [Desulfobacteraceae bacterium IS3]|nr:MAG: hypothetical protein BWK80_53235 [Desulfobacteraceae bacterium IS3]HAO19769.1 nucleotidyltransferase [Desulfobacteraceae bacterium]
MQKNTVSDINELGKYLNQIHFFSELNTDKVGIFGSFARGENANDIDLLLEEPVDYEALIRIRLRMEKDLDKKADFVIRKFANPIILHRAEKGFEICYEISEMTCFIA